MKALHNLKTPERKKRMARCRGGNLNWHDLRTARALSPTTSSEQANIKEEY